LHEIEVVKYEGDEWEGYERAIKDSDSKLLLILLLHLVAVQIV